MNPGIWGFIDYSAKLAAHKRSLEPSIRNDLTPYSTTSPINRTESEVVEKSAASMAVPSIPASIVTEIALQYIRKTISSPKAPATPKYHGDTSLTLNVPADVESSQNVRFWVTGLPPSITTTELLGAIRGVGSIFATNIVKPQLPEAKGDNRQRVRTSAASITFFTAAAGNIFMEKTLKIGDYEALVRPNRIATAPMLQNNRSRVLVIEGDRDLVNPKNLQRLAATWDIQYVTDSIVYTYYGGARSRVFWAFGSFRAQAHAMFLRLRELSATGKVYVRYGIDPCASFERREKSYRQTLGDC